MKMLIVSFLSSFSENARQLRIRNVDAILSAVCIPRDNVRCLLVVLPVVRHLARRVRPAAGSTTGGDSRVPSSYRNTVEYFRSDAV